MKHAIRFMKRALQKSQTQRDNLILMPNQKNDEAVPTRIWLPHGPAQLAAVSPELQNIDGAWRTREDADPVNAARIALEQLTEEQRADLFSEYCVSCGSKDPRCRCWDDT
jgi:hypothetical protein